MSGLRARVAAALGWTEEQAGSFSFASLREIVRPVSEKLARELTVAIQSGSYVGEPAPPEAPVNARSPKNRTRYRSLDAVAADPRVVEVWSEEDSGDGLWAQLAPGWNWDGSSCLHEWSCRELIAALRDKVVEGEPY